MVRKLSFLLFTTSGLFCVWRPPKEAYNPEVKHGGRCAMIWGGISWYSAGAVITLNGRNTASDYVDILGDGVHPVVQMFPDTDAVFQDNSPIHTARSVQSWFEKHEDAHHLPWPAHSPDLNPLEPLWPVLESRVRSEFPPPSSLKQLEDVHEYGAVFHWGLFRTY